MKPIIQKLMMLIAVLCAFVPASAYDFEVDGIYYNIVSLDDLTCEVTYDVSKETKGYSVSFGGTRYSSATFYPSYSGDVVVPEKVNYKGRELTVTGIGSYAFLYCRNLKSLSLPSSITSIADTKVMSGVDAAPFDYCQIENLTAGNAYILQKFDESKAYAYSENFGAKYFLKNLILSDDFYGVINVNFSPFAKLVSIQSNTLNVPTFSDGIHFSNNQYLNVLVKVSFSVIDHYKSTVPWSSFWDIVAIDSLATSPDELDSYDFNVDGIYYNIVSLDDLTCEVTYDVSKETKGYSVSFGGTRYSSATFYPSYSGDVVVPEKVNYKGRELTVTGIGSFAFLYCRTLKSLSLPSSITSIADTKVMSGVDAAPFDYCQIENLTAGNAYILQKFDESKAYAYSENFGAKYFLKNLILSDDFYGVINVNFSPFAKLVSIQSNTMNVPYFSEGQHFTNEQYLNVEVLVPEQSIAKYQSADIWKSFWDLKAMKSVTSITLNETSINLEPNQTNQLIATVLPADAFDSTVVWYTSNPNVATVDANGLVTAVTKGDAVITVSSTDGSNVSAQCSVHVDLLVKEITLSESEIGLEPGQSKKLIATIKPEDAFVKDVIWKSYAEDIVVVDQEGNVTAKNIGIANVSVQTTDGSNLSANCKVTVAELVKGIDVLPNETTIREGETLQLTCKISPETATYKDVVWESEDIDIVSVDANGLVSAISSGKTIIKAIASDGSNVYGECNITVTAETLEIDGIYYQRNSPSSLKIVANPYSPYSGNFFISTSVELNGQEMTITEIGENAFAGCEDLQRIVIPSSITKISNTAFTGCSNLVYIKICEGSSLNINLDKTFPDSPINDFYIGSNNITYDSDSRLLGLVKGMTLSSNVISFPPAKAFQSLEYFIVESGDMPLIEPGDYCTKSQSLTTQQTVNDSYTHIMYRFFYLVTYQHLSPILKALQNSTLNYVHIDREIQTVEVDTSKKQEKIPTTAGSRYQEYGYMDECNYSYQELIAKSEFNRNPIESISFDKGTIKMEIGKSIYPKIIFNPNNASFKTLIWSSSDGNVATVDMFGNVTKISYGEAEITATTTDGSNLSAKCKIVDMGAGVENISTEDSISVITKNGDIIVSGAHGNYLTEVYDTRGQLLIRTTKQIIELGTKGVYIVKIGTYTQKIIL